MGARRYQISRKLEASPAAVWELLTDAERYKDWNSAVVSIKGPIKLGNKIELVSTADPKRTFTLKVTEMQAPNRMVWSDGMPMGLFLGERTYTVTENADGGSEFTMVEEFTGLLAPLITRVIPDLTSSFEAFADSLAFVTQSAEPND